MSKLSKQDEIASYTDFKNTLIAQSILQSKINRFNDLPELRKGIKEEKELLKQIDSINTRFRINPLVEVLEDKYILKSSIENLETYISTLIVKEITNEIDNKSSEMEFEDTYDDFDDVVKEEFMKL